MTEAERLNFLLNHKLAMRVGVPEALDIRLNPQKEYEQLLYDKADRLFLEKHRSQAVDIMRVRLRDRVHQSLPYYSATLRSQRHSQTSKSGLLNPTTPMGGKVLGIDWTTIISPSITAMRKPSRTSPESRLTPSSN